MLHDLDDIVTLDFETYYSKDYSLTLKAYNTSSYVRDPQFKAQCLGIRDGRKPTVWYAGPDIRKALNKHAVYKRPIAAHNMAFDGFILSQHYDLVPPFYYCTLSNARALLGNALRLRLDDVARYHGLGAKTDGLVKTKGLRDLPDELLEELGEYCANDTDLCADVLALQLQAMPEKELRLVDWTMRAFCDPVLYVDQDLAAKELEDQISRREERVELAQVSQEVLMSDEKFADVLTLFGVEVPQKISPTDGQLKYALSKQDKAFTDLLEHDDPAVVRLVEARLAVRSTIGESRARRFVDIGSNTLPMAYNYCAAHTKRFGGTNKMNVQNLERDGHLRKAIIAPPDHVIVSVDSKQIEGRLNAWLWDQENILEAFRTGQDIYKLQASQTYGKPIEEISKDERFVGKVQILGLGYGMGAKKFKNVLQLGLMGPAMDISLDTAYDWVNAYRRTNNRVAAGWEYLNKVLYAMAHGSNGEYKCFGWETYNGSPTVWLPSGLPLIYDNLHAREHERGVQMLYKSNANGKHSNIWGGLVDENWVQALARCVVTDQMLLVMDAGWRVVGMTHDEIIAVCHKSQADRCLDEITKAMQHVPPYVAGAPIDAEGGYDIRYS